MEAHEKELLILSQEHQDNCVFTDKNEENDSLVNRDDENRLTFARSIPVNAPALENIIPETELRVSDSADARNEHKIAIANWTQ